jgi:hypothetical protein
VLDRDFDEDRSRVRAGHTAETLALLHRFALNLLKHDPSSPRGIKNKHLKTAYSDTFRLSRFNLSPFLPIVRLPCRFCSMDLFSKVKHDSLIKNNLKSHETGYPWKQRSRYAKIYCI